MKNNGRPRLVNNCPVCGNEIPWALMHNKGSRIIKCPFCKEVFHRKEVVREKERNDD